MKASEFEKALEKTYHEHVTQSWGDWEIEFDTLPVTHYQGVETVFKDDTKDFISELLLTHKKKVQSEMVMEILKRADILEHECSKDGDKGTEQWKAFKGFRNGIYDIANAKGLNIE